MGWPLATDFAWLERESAYRYSIKTQVQGRFPAQARQNQCSGGKNTARGFT